MERIRIDSRNSALNGYSKKNLNAPRPSEYPPVRGKNVKTFRWDHRLQIQNLSMAFKAVVKYVGGFWPIGVFFAGYRSFFFVPSRQTQTKARL